MGQYVKTINSFGPLSHLVRISISIFSAHLLQGLPLVLLPFRFTTKTLLLVVDHSFELSVLPISAVSPL
jgi:hypothetical protein